MSKIQIGLEIVAMFFVLVTLHEWGHFYFAKRAGILVREFAIGFGPKLFSYKKGETRYTLRILPIGGYVRMAGEDPEVVQIAPGQTIALQLAGGKVTHFYADQLHSLPGLVIGTVEQVDLERKLDVRMNVDEESVRFPVDREAVVVSGGKEIQIAPWDRQFGSKPVGARALSIFAGPLMNFLLAFVLFVVFMFLNGVPMNVKIGGVEQGSPAEKAGLMQGDIISEVVTAGGQEQIGSDRGKLTTLIKNSQGQPMDWIVTRTGVPKKISVTPKDGRVGISLDWDTRPTKPGEAIKGAGDQLAFYTKQILLGFKMLVFGQFKMDDLGGPVRIVEVSSDFAQAGISYMISWSGLLSLYLGLFNLLPIPALDGSRLVFLGIEAVRGKPVDPNRESMVHFIGFAMLMLLMIAVTYNDILRLITKAG